MPYAYPSGEELTTRICHESEPALLTTLGANPSLAKEFTDALRNSDAPSVDAFLELRPKFMDVGKLAIAHHLIQCENSGALRNDWYRHLLARMSSPLAEFKENQVAFITFNYDRSLEHYFYTALCNRYEKPPERIAEVLNGIPFVHVHGQLGYLPWQNADASKKRDYLRNVNPPNSSIAANGIKIISEDIDASAEFTRGRELMDAAHNIFLLGFGYHHVNIRRLGLPLGKKPIIGTAYGLTDAEKTKITKDHFGLSLWPQAHHKVLDVLRHSEVFQDSVTNT